MFLQLVVGNCSQSHHPNSGISLTGVQRCCFFPVVLFFNMHDIAFSRHWLTLHYMTPQVHPNQPQAKTHHSPCQALTPRQGRRHRRDHCHHHRLDQQRSQKNTVRGWKGQPWDAYRRYPSLPIEILPHCLGKHLRGNMVEVWILVLNMRFLMVRSLRFNFKQQMVYIFLFPHDLWTPAG